MNKYFGTGLALNIEMNQHILFTHLRTNSII